MISLAQLPGREELSLKELRLMHFCILPKLFIYLARSTDRTIVLEMECYYRNQLNIHYRRNGRSNKTYFRLHLYRNGVPEVPDLPKL